jgi:FkbM family methyltransferase
MEIDAASAPEIRKIEFAGRTFVLDPFDGADLVAQKIEAGSYEAPLPIMLAAVIARMGGVFIDVGANNGVYSLIAATIRPDVRVVAFEPYPPVLELLHRNIRLNGFEERITVMEMALSDTEGKAVIFLPDPAHGLVETSASLQADFIAGAQPAMEVTTKRLDDLDLNGSISVAKVDIEGFELEFIRGAEQTIRKNRPIIFAEMLTAVPGKFSEITIRMAAMDYLAFRLRKDEAILTHWVRLDVESWNYAFIPKEKMPVFRECCTVHGLEILAPA